MLTRRCPSLLPAVACTLLATVALVRPAAADDPADARKPAAHPSETAHPEEVPMAGVVVLSATRGHEVRGTLRLQQQSAGLRITGRIEGLTPGKHGFHVHEFGDLADPEGKSAGGHFNPGKQPHGGPDSAERHEGDLGNIEADAQGVANVDVVGRGLKLHFVLGRSIVVHAKADDLKSQPAGDAGDRVAVGVIGIAGPQAHASGEPPRPTTTTPRAPRSR